MYEEKDHCDSDTALGVAADVSGFHLLLIMGVVEENESFVHDQC